MDQSFLEDKEGKSGGFDTKRFLLKVLGNSTQIILSICFFVFGANLYICLLYTSDAADE